MTKILPLNSIIIENKEKHLDWTIKLSFFVLTTRKKYHVFYVLEFLLLLLFFHL